MERNSFGLFGGSLGRLQAAIWRLIEGMAAFDRRAALELDGVIAATVLAFGFVYAHPFVDGNGRIHRNLIHHVLAEREFNPAGVVFPVSAAILERFEDYRAALEDYSQRLIRMIDWHPTEDGNVKILNDTADFYRFFDATPHAEFLYGCVQKTIEVDLQREAAFLAQYDQFRARTEAIVDTGSHHRLTVPLSASEWRPSFQASCVGSA